MKKIFLILCTLSLTAFGIELFAVLYNFFGRQAVHPKVEGLNSLATLLANPGLVVAVGSFFLIGLIAHIAIALSSLCSTYIARHQLATFQSRLLVGILFTGLQLILLRASNHIHFPKSLHDQALPLPDSWLLPLLILSIVTAPTIIIFQTLIRRPLLAIVPGCLLAITGAGYISANQHNAATRSAQPNIIILGVDSLRPDHMMGGNYDNVSDTPFLDQQLQQSIWYQNAYTPTARTYPAWASLLTGAYPKGHGVRFGLTSSEQAKAHDSIAWALQDKGYHTVYAMDERRFSYVDQAWGFEEVLGPRAGAADFILGTLYDISVLNLLGLLPRSDLMLPYTVNNRAIETLYDPVRFANDTARDIQNTPQDQPLFFAAHLCLPHWPFGWKDYEATYGWKDSEGRQRAYGDALSESDKQLSIIWNALEASGRLENSIVIFMSDHGEGHGLHDDHIAHHEQLITEDPNLTPITNTTGHGTNILAIKQHEVLLAIQDRRHQQPPFQVVRAPASLLDVYPTLLQAVLPDPTQTTPTRSLLAPETIVSDAPNWHLFFESGFTVKALRKLNPSIEEVASQTMSYYRLTENGRLAIRTDLWDTLLETKQRGVLTADQSMLAFTRADMSGESLVSYFDGESEKLSPTISHFDSRTKLLRELVYSHFDQEFSSLHKADSNNPIRQ